TPPFWTYMTVSAASPWEKIDSFLRYSTTFLATPAVSRKTCGSKEPLLPFFLSFFAFIVASKLHLGVDIPPQYHPTKKGCSGLYKIVQRASLPPSKFRE